MLRGVGVVDGEVGYEKDVARFWSYVDKQSNCWLWMGSKNRSGYGTFWFMNECVTAHRFSAFISGLVDSVHSPKDRKQTGFILHQCDNPACVNPAHFKVGTYADNQREAYARNRRSAYKGDRHVNAKLSRKDASEIRKRYAGGGVRQQDLAEQYGVSQRTISLIVRGETYAE